MDLDTLAPRVLGYTVEDGGAIYIPVIMAQNPGNGDVGRYLDSLPTDRTVRVPNVLAPRLAGMLERRGFTLTQEYDGEVWMQWIPIWERRAT